MHRRRLLVPLFLVGSAFAACGGDDSGPAAPPDPDAYVPPSDVFMQDYDPARVVDSERDGLSYAADQLVVVLETPGDQATLDQVAALAGGTKVGQIPALGLYQLQIEPQTEDGMDTIVANAAAVPGVRTAMPSATSPPLPPSNPACPSMPASSQPVPAVSGTAPPPNEPPKAST